MKDSSDNDECKSACENKSACTGFAISNSGYSSAPNRCIIYGNISSVSVDNLPNSDAWIAYTTLPYGFKGFEVDSSSGYSGVRCFKRLNQENQNDGKFPMLSPS